MRLLFILSTWLCALLVYASSTNTHPVPEPPSFYRDVFPIIFSKCSGQECHGGDSRATVRYSSYRSIYSYRKKIMKRIYDELKPMPPQDHTALTEEEKKVLELWIQSGAPEN